MAGGFRGSRSRTRISCGRYRFVFYLAGFVVSMQLLVAWSFFNFGNSDESDPRKRDVSGSRIDTDEVLKGERTPQDKNRNHPTLQNNKLLVVQNQVNEHRNNFPGSHDNGVVNNGQNNILHQDQLVNQETNQVGVMDFSPKCAINGKDTLSALHRAKTSVCKQKIVDTYCEVEDGIVYPQMLPRYCPLPGKPALQVEMVGEDFNPAVDKPVRIVYILIVNGRAFRQIRRLFKVLYHIDHYFYIHVDARSDYLHRELSQMAQWYPNVRLTPWRMSTIWGGASLLQMLLKCMQDLLNMTDWYWDFFINISESDFPIKTNDQLVSFLSMNRNYNFLKSHGRDDTKFIRKQGLDRTFLECDNHMWRLGDRKLPKGITIDGGSDWLGLNRQFCEYLITSDDDLITGLKIFYKYTLLPAESFFHTVLENSELCQTMVDNNLRVTNWKRKLGCQCQYKHIVDWCGCSPNVFKPEDLPKIKTARPTFFARKFEPSINQEVINRLDGWLYGDYPISTIGLELYWQSIFHMDDDISIPSDAFWTAYQSFIRISSESFRTSLQAIEYNEGCMYAFNMAPVEVNMFMRADDFRGLMITYEGMSRSGRKDWLESWLLPQRYYNIIEPLGPAGRIRSIKVGTQYDLKERVFRNVGNIMGPYDDPRILLQIDQGTQATITCMWVDPIDQIADVNDINLEADSEIGYYKTEMHKPLRPGEWTIKLYHNHRVIAETKFIIIPLYVRNLQPVTLTDVIEMHNGPPNGVYAASEKTFLDLQSPKDSQSPAAELASLNAKKTGFELSQWIDGLLMKYWKVHETCVTIPKRSIDMTPSCSKVQQCHETKWSTRSPDPKSELGPIKSNGRIR
ncbi:xylosyltransferase 1-like [Saccoglossus kowalevskii]